MRVFPAEKKKTKLLFGSPRGKHHRKPDVILHIPKSHSQSQFPGLSYVLVNVLLMFCSAFSSLPFPSSQMPSEKNGVRNFPREQWVRVPYWTWGDSRARCLWQLRCWEGSAFHFLEPRIVCLPTWIYGSGSKAGSVWIDGQQRNSIKRRIKQQCKSVRFIGGEPLSAFFASFPTEGVWEILSAKDWRGILLLIRCDLSL